MQNELLGLSQCLSSHPMLTEKETFVVKYLNVLDYFVRHFSEEDILAKETLNLYIEALVGVENYIYEITDIRKTVRQVDTLKFKEYKLFRYRYILLFDCFFINALNDPHKAIKIKERVKTIFHDRYHKKIEQFYRLLYYNDDSVKFNRMNNQLECWKKNKDFFNQPLRKILITANMSAGKSTLINALVGKKINRTQNDACTAKIHYIFNKSFEDNYSYELDYKLQMNADMTTLMQDNAENKSDEISVGTFFRWSKNNDERICIIDTPGVNSSQDKVHRDISEKKILESRYEKLIYVMNGENIGTDDERRHLEFIAENYKGTVIFVVNKLDCYRKEDSIQDTLQLVKKDLEGLGYKQPIICPISAYSAYLAKMDMFGEKLNDDEMDELDRFYRKLSKDEYQLNQLYPEGYRDIEVSEDKNQQLLLHSGILSLERILI